MVRISRAVIGVCMMMVTYEVTAAGTGNPAHDALAASPVDVQAYSLGRVVGDECGGGGESAFFMGMHKRKTAFWSVRCRDGSAFSVQIDPDAKGKTTILECSALKKVANIDCFKKF